MSSVWGDDKLIWKAEGLRFFLREFLWFCREMEHLGCSEITNHKDSTKRLSLCPKILAQEVPTDGEDGAWGQESAWNCSQSPPGQLLWRWWNRVSVSVSCSLSNPFLCNSVRNIPVPAERWMVSLQFWCFCWILWLVDSSLPWEGSSQSPKHVSDIEGCA